MSRFGICRLIGVPSVCPSKTPERILTVSVSLRWVTSALWPGARRSRSGWMSASESGRRGVRLLLFVEPDPCESRSAVTVGTPEREGARVAHVGLVVHEPAVVGHPHPEHLIELPVHDLLRDRALVGTIRSLSQLERQLVD